MNNSIFTNILTATDDSDPQEKQLSLQLNCKVKQRKLYIVHLTTPGEVAVTQHDPRDLDVSMIPESWMEKASERTLKYRAGKLQLTPGSRKNCKHYKHRKLYS